MKNLLIRLAINAVALYAAVYLLGSHIQLQQENWLSILWLAVIFGLVNALLKPLLMVVSCPLIILTLGLGTLLVNTLLFLLAGWIGTQFNVGFTVDGLLWAFVGALIVSVVSFILSRFLAGELKS
jgi:putative membrane protein